MVDHSDVVSASPVGAAPTTSSFLTYHLASMDWAKTTARWDEKHLSFGIWYDFYERFDGMLFWAIIYVTYRHPIPTYIDTCICICCALLNDCYLKFLLSFFSKMPQNIFNDVSKNWFDKLCLTYWGLNQKADILQTRYLDPFFIRKSFLFWFKSHHSFFTAVQFMICQHWFR